MTTNNTWRDADHEVVGEVFAELLGAATRHRDEAAEASATGDSAVEALSAQRCSAILDAITVLAAARATGDRNP